MYIIEPVPVTHISGLLNASNVAYPDSGLYIVGDTDTTSYPRWVPEATYASGAVVVHFGGLFKALTVVPDPSRLPYSRLPPGHPQSILTWERQPYPIDWSNATDHAVGATVRFPVVTYATTWTPPADMTDTAAVAAAFAAASVPTMTPAGYPSGVWRRNDVQDDGESLLPKYPSLLSKYWYPMEPPLFARYPEIPVGELTTYGGRIWQKRTETLADYEAPPSAPLDWALHKTSNRFAMFDKSVQSQSRRINDSLWVPSAPVVDVSVLSVTLTPGAQVVDALALLNLGATTVQVQVQSGSPLETVYDRTVNLNADVNAANWYDWFFAKRHTLSSLVLDDLPPVAGRIVITITNTGSQAVCGVCIVGKQTYIGDALYGASVGIKDYSLKTADEFGNITTKQRAYSDRMTVPVRLHTDSISRVKLLLAKYRTVPLVWVGHASIPSTIVYGYYKDFSAVINYADDATCNLEIEGLT